MIMDDNIKNKVIELTDEEMDNVSGGRAVVYAHYFSG
jgi:bacteriocin-like protein